MDAENARRAIRIKMLERYGINVAERSADEWLQLALDAEATKLACGPFDAAYELLSNQQRRFEDAAALAELIS